MSDRSPRYPRISLADAIPLAIKLFDREGRSPVTEEVAVKHWGYKGVNGTSNKILSAVRKYGLIEDVKGGVKISNDAIAIAAHRNDRFNPDYSAAVSRCAHRVELFAALGKEFGLGASEQNIAAQLVKRGFSQEGALKAARSYRATMELAGGGGGGYIPSDDKPTVKLGDYVQWTSSGQDQFQPPRQVTWISEDGAHVRVHASMTGIPASEVTVVKAPAPPAPAGLQGVEAKGTSGAIADPKNISVLLSGNRLQITADVDAAGLGKLKKMLDKYEEILKLQG